MKRSKILLFTAFLLISISTNAQKIGGINKVEEVLIEVLQNSEMVKKYDSNKKQVSNYPLFPPLILSYYDESNNRIVEFNSFVEYLSYILNTKDMDYLKMQLDSNKDYLWSQLSESGVEIYDVEKIYQSGLEEDSIYNILYQNRQEFIMISPPVFNKSKNKFFIKIGTLTTGSAIICSFKDGSWEVTDYLSNWVE